MDSEGTEKAWVDEQNLKIMQNISEDIPLVDHGMDFFFTIFNAF